MSFLAAGSFYIYLMLSLDGTFSFKRTHNLHSCPSVITKNLSKTRDAIDVL